MARIEKGDTILLCDGEDQWSEATVWTPLSAQFTAVDRQGKVEFLFYHNEGVTWKLPEQGK